VATTYYYSIEGQILGQQVLGEAEGKDYLLDASGNLVGVYQGDYLKADASYDAFGNILDSWNISFYNFTWGGGHGYRQTGLAFSSVYVRARHYSNLDAGWTTRDPLWPSEMPYGYVNGRVPGDVDYCGMASIITVNPWAIGGGYSHAYLQFNIPCDNTKSAGFFARCADPLIGPAGLFPDFEKPRLLMPAGGHLVPYTNPFPKGAAPSGKVGIPGLGLPGKIICPDRRDRIFDKPGETVNRVHTKNNNDPRFEEALCECVQERKRQGAPSYTIGYVCGSFAHQMWDCAKAKIYQKYGYMTKMPSYISGTSNNATCDPYSSPYRTDPVTGFNE